MIPWRRAEWFVLASLILAFWMGVLGTLPHDALGGVIPSHGGESGGGRYTDLDRLQRFLETKIARQKLEDFGVPPDEALAKLREMSDQDLHVLASVSSRVPEGGDDGDTLVDLFIIMAVLAVVLLVILVILGVLGVGALAKYMKKKPETPQAPPAAAPEAVPAR